MDSVIYNTKNATINFYNIIYKFNHEQLDLILNSKINFKLYKDNKYVCFSNTNNKIITILEFLFKLKISFVVKSGRIKIHNRTSFLSGSGECDRKLR